MLHLFPIRDDAASKSFMFVGCLYCLFWEAVMLSNRTVLVIIAGLRMTNAFRDHLVFCDEVHRNTGVPDASDCCCSLNMVFVFFIID